MEMQLIRMIGLEIISGGSYSTYDNDHYGEVIWGSDLAPNANIRDHYYDSTSKNMIGVLFLKLTLMLLIT